MSFLSFKGITHTYFVKISKTHNNKRIPLLNLLINCISARSAPQILSIKGEYTFIFLNFLIAGLCNFSANSLLEIFPIPLPKVHLSGVAKVFDCARKADFLSKNL